MNAPNAVGVAQRKLRVNWEAHVEALPLPTWIIGQDTEAVELSVRDGSPESLRGCEQVFLNQACRELLGFTSDDSPSLPSWQRYLHPKDRPASL